jgi:hypothetical protein
MDNMMFGKPVKQIPAAHKGIVNGGKGNQSGKALEMILFNG